MSGSGNGAGMKRKKTHIPSDFKRHRKAKVGKRATQQVNLTDTSFKAVSVQVKGQSIAASESKIDGPDGKLGVLSSRGKSIADLTHQLYHPAGAVRVSAIRGIVNVIQGTCLDILQAHLSTLLPVIAKCACVDDEGDVRTLGLTALRELIHKHESDSAKVIHLDKSKHHIITYKLWKPFIPLLVAFVTSALNSLDRLTRLDGSRAVEIIAFLTLDRKTVSTILPAYITLLQDHSSQNRIINNMKSDAAEGKPKKKADDNKRLVILQSLVSLLRSRRSIGNELVSNWKVLEEPDLSVLPACSNALILLSSRHMNRVESLPLQQTVDVVIEQWNNHASKPSLEKNSEVELKDSIVMDLFSKLRDVLVEVSQRGSQGELGLTMGLADMEELSLIISSMHLLYKSFATHYKGKRRAPVISYLVTMMLESMPIKARSFEPQHQGRYEALNGSICLSVIEMGPDALKDDERMDTILEFLLPALDPSNMNQSAITMNVLHSLLQLEDAEDQHAISKDAQDLVLKRIAHVYFSNQGDTDTAITRSIGGRKAVQMVVQLFKNWIWQNEPIPDLLLQMIRYFPFYLLAWRGDYLEDSNNALELLTRIVRRTNIPSQTVDLIPHLREGMTQLFTTAFKKELSVFETYTPSMQRKTICLVVSLESPSPNLMNALSKICAKAGTGISHELADYICNIIHTTRTTMTIQAYLGFVLSTIGVPKCPNTFPTVTNKEGEDTSSMTSQLQLGVRSKDNAVMRAARVLRSSCGTSNNNNKVLAMIAPMLCSWLIIPQAMGMRYCRETLIRFRVVLLLMSTFAQEVNAFECISDLQTMLQGSILNFFQACEDDQAGIFSAFEKPIVAQPVFLKDLVEESTKRVKDDAVTAGNIVKILYDISRKPLLADAIRERSSIWVESTTEMVSSLSESPYLRSAELMLTHLRILVGDRME